MTLTYTDLLGSDVNYGRKVTRKVFVAYCYSERCNTRGWHGTSSCTPIPEAKRGDIDCRRCGHALCWRTEEES